MRSSGVEACPVNAGARQDRFARKGGFHLLSYRIMGPRISAEERAEKVAKARAWRERRRCPACGAFAFDPCIHRPDGAHGDARVTAIEHMPFPGHRTVAEIDELTQLRKIGGL